MPLTSMQMTPKEAKEEYGQPDVANMPKYPYGLCISLDDDSMKKLGITALPAAGAEMMISAKVVVTSARVRQDQSGENEQSMDLQITEMAIGAPEKSAADLAQTLYSK